MSDQEIKIRFFAESQYYFEWIVRGMLTDGWQKDKERIKKVLLSNFEEPAYNQDEADLIKKVINDMSIDELYENLNFDAAADYLMDTGLNLMFIDKLTDRVKKIKSDRKP